MERHDDPVFEGVVEDGVIRSRGLEKLPDGTRVEVRVVARRVKRKTPAGQQRKREPVASPDLMKFAGIIKNAPPDASYNLDHYLYGAPKKKRR